MSSVSDIEGGLTQMAGAATDSAPGVPSSGTTAPTAPPAGMMAPAMPRFGGLTLSGVRKIWKISQGSTMLAVVTVVLLLVVAGMQLAPSFAPMVLAKLGNPGEGRLSAYGLLVLLLIASILGMAGQAISGYMSTVLAESMGRRIKLALFRKIGSLPAKEANSHSIGAMAFRIAGDVQQIRDFFTPGLLTLLSDLFVLLIAFVVMAVFAWPYALIVLAAGLLIGVLTRRTNRKIGAFAMDSQMASERAMTQYIEGVAGYRDLAASDRFGRAASEFDRRLAHQERAMLGMQVWSSIANIAPMVVFNVLYFGYYFLIAAQGANHDAINAQRVAMAVTFVSVLAFIRGPIVQLTQFSSRVAASAPSFQKVLSLIDAPEVKAAAQQKAIASNGIDFDHVTFRYSPELPPVLNDISFTIKPGSFTAIVGQSGSGKTTLFHMLLRLLDPTEGKVRIGGVDLETVGVAELRRFIGFIPQAPFIFDSTIRDNLTLGAESQSFVGQPQPVQFAQEKELLDVVKMARLEELVRRRALMGGLDAPVGPGGASLSGGERQRIALGRLLLRDPQIVVCDEYTANIDNATAKLIRESLEQRFAGRTRVVVTHQLYTIRGADQILVLDQGRIVDRGTHEELLSRPGLYKEMWELQRIG